MTEDQVAHTIRDAGLAATKQRIALMRALYASRQPRSVEDLARSLTARMNQATVYRSLKELVDVHLVQRVEFGENHARFEASRSHHHHVVCRSCSRIEDVASCLPVSLTARIRRETGFARIEDHALEFFGLCAACDTKGR